MPRPLRVVRRCTGETCGCWFQPCCWGLFVNEFGQVYDEHEPDCPGGTANTSKCPNCGFEVLVIRRPSGKGQR